MNDLHPAKIMSMPSIRLLIVFTGVTLLAGCGDGRPVRVPVSGMVYIDGKPLTVGVVRFVPDKGRPSVGEIDQSGRFQLSCYEMNDGATVGEHHVAVVAAEPLPGDRRRWHAPKSYSDYKSSGLIETVSSSPEEIRIDLTWGNGKPFTES